MDLGDLGKRVQGLRVERGMTLQDLAAASAVSISMLSAVEHGQKAATVVVMDRIARGLGMSLAVLVATAADARLIVRRAADQEVIDEPGGWRRTVLSPIVPGVNFEWIKVVLPPGCDAGRYPAYAPGSHEYVAVRTGSLQVQIDDHTIRLGAGESLYFAADVPHGYQNTGSAQCEYYVAAIIMRPRSPKLR